MRLICPNCGAQYEVADDVIPQAGRDVQCSNCGHTWFENRGASAAHDEEAHQGDLDAATDDADVHDDEDQDAEDVAEPAAMAPESEPESEPEPEPQEADHDDAPSAPTAHDDEISDSVAAARVSLAETFGAKEEKAPEAVAPPPAPPAQPAGESKPRSAITDSIADILREEAAREDAARKAEMSGGLESQGDLGLESASSIDAQRKQEAATRIARMKGEENAAAVAAAAAATRREMLPDIEEINSTLRSSAERGEAPPPMPEEVRRSKRMGFRFGFMTVLTLFIVLIAIYLLADQIRTAVPALEDVLTQYVAVVDNLRLWIDAQVQDLRTGLEAVPTTDAPATTDVPAATPTPGN
jgi:predicted Zn finger-like uncharacterized protein